MKRANARRPVVVVAAIVIVGVVGGFGVSLAIGQNSAGEFSVSSESPPATLQEALADNGITIEVTPNEAAEVPAAEAVEAARSEMPMVGDAIGTVTLVRFTDEQYDHENATSLEEASNITPKFESKKAWIVAFDKVEVPILGGPIADSREGGKTTYTSTMVVFIDSDTGAFLEAIAVQS